MGEMEVTSAILVTNKRLYTSRAAMKEVVDLVTSGEYGLPVLGEQANVSGKIVFKKMFPTTTEGLHNLVRGLRSVDLTLMQYLPATKLQELHVTHSLEIPGLDEAAILQLVAQATANKQG